MISELFFLNQTNAQTNQLPKVKWELLKLCLGILINGRDASAHGLSFQCSPALQVARSVGDPLGGWSLPSSGYSVELPNILSSSRMATVGIYWRYYWHALTSAIWISTKNSKVWKWPPGHLWHLAFRKQVRRWMLEREMHCAVRFLP